MRSFPGEFAEYNYGRQGNLKRYGRDLPPLYDFSKITSYVALYYSNADVVAPTTVTIHIHEYTSSHYCILKEKRKLFQILIQLSGDRTNEKTD